MRKSRGINTYSGAHRNTTLVRGVAAMQACCKCGEGAHEWALKHGVATSTDYRGMAFSKDPFDYQPMCRGCHRRYDKEHITACPKGHRYTAENTIIDSGKRKCKECVYERNRMRRKQSIKRELRAEPHTEYIGRQLLAHQDVEGGPA